MSHEGSGEVDGAMASGGESQGKAKPLAPHSSKSGFKGGQTRQGYHGSGQLGDKRVGSGNSNAPSTRTEQ